ncbi:MAG: hypothetical protein EHM33_00425 [Chloroflexi bacterium]|nr:MAG: hypothetical protein EHM33_00425 [Chloroflexota bacterium]
MADDPEISSDVLSEIMGKDPEAPKASQPVPRTPSKEPEPDEPDDQPYGGPDEPVPEGEDDVEAAAEPEDNIDDYLVEVTVDGKPVEVSLKELKKTFSGNKFVEQNITKAVETRKHVEAQAYSLYQSNQQAMAKLQQIDAVLSTVTEPQIDWVKLKATDPQGYILKKEEVRDAQDRQYAVQMEIQRVQEEQAQLQADAQSRYLSDQADALAAKLPEMRDPRKAPELMGKFTDAAAYYGYTKQELGQVMDHRALLVLNDAAKYRALVKKQRDSANTPVEKKLMLRPSAAKPAVQATRRLDKNALARAQRTGRAEDVAATLLVRAK